MWLRVASVVCDIIHVVSCGQRGARDVSFVFVTCGQRGTRDISCSSASPSALNHAEVCVIEGKLFLVTTSGGTAVRIMRKVAKRWLTFHLSKRNSTPSSFWAALSGYVDTYQPNTDMRPKCWGSGKMPGTSWDGVPPKSGLGSAATARCNLQGEQTDDEEPHLFCVF